MPREHTPVESAPGSQATGRVCAHDGGWFRTLDATMPKQTSGSKKCGRGGSPKKAIKRLRRKAIATLREARLTAQLELVAAEAAGAQLRERAIEAAATETAQV